VLKPAFSLDQITHQLTTSWGGPDQGEPHRWFQAVPVTYALPDVAPPSLRSESAGFVQMTPFMKQQAGLAFELWDDLISVSLQESTINAADIAFGNLTSAPTTQAYAYLPNSVITSNPAINAQIIDIGGDVWVSLSQATNLQLDEGRYGMQTLAHEIGHALGLSHPGAYNEDGGHLSYQEDAAYLQDTRQYTVMSYWGAGSDGRGAIHGGWLTSTPLLHDVMAVQ